MKRCPTCQQTYTDEVLTFCRVDGATLLSESPGSTEVQTQLLSGVRYGGSRMSPIPKLCVCGRSKSFPICDNSHAEEGWTCASNSTWEKIGFSSSFRYENLARKLASHFHGALYFPGSPVSVVDRLVIITDASDLDFLLPLSRAVQARERVVITFGVRPGLVGPAFEGSRVFDLGDVQPIEAFRHITAVLDGKTNEAGFPPPVRVRSAFISHAVTDEALLCPVVNYLRSHFRSDLFLCADSINPGENWQNVISGALLEREFFISLLSKAALTSTFCAFEMGMASALKKPMFILSMDGTKPPSFIQHIQAIDLPRLKRQKPWLEVEDVLLDELLRILCE